MRSLATACAVAVLAAAPAGAQILDLPLPDVDLRGSVTYSLEETKTPQDEERRWRNLVTGTLTPSTYIYAPWLATLGGNLHVSQAVESGGNDSSSSYITGRMVLNVLPRSSYPFEFQYSRYNNAISAVTAEDELELSGQTFRMLSRLLLPDQWTVATEGILWDNADTEGFEETGREANLVIHKIFEKNDVQVEFGFRDSDLIDEDGNEELGQLQSVVLRHRSTPFEGVTSDSMTSLRLNEFSSEEFTETGSVAQGVGTMFWRPKEIPELTVFGATRTFQQSARVVDLESSEARESDFQTAFANLSASYLIMPRLVANAGGDLGYRAISLSSDEEAAESGGLSMGANAGLDYSSQPVPLWGFDWLWNTGATARFQNELDQSEMTENVRVGHSLTRSLELPLLGTMNAGFTQAVGVGHSTLIGPGVSLSHNLNLGRSNREGKHWDYIQASLSDSRTMSQDPFSYQLVNLQFTRGYDPDRFTSFSGSISLQFAKQTLDGVDVNGWEDTLTGDLSYSVRSLWGVDNLTFTSRLTLNPPSLMRSRRYDFSGFASLDRRQDEGFGAQRWVNRLEYRIGKMRIGLVGQLRNNGDGLSESVLFQIGRNF